MNSQQFESIIEEVLSRYKKENDEAKPLLTSSIALEVSARHVHLTKEAMEVLFGKNSTLISKRALSQPGEFLSEQRVKLITTKGVIDNVAVLGPLRSAVQCELSYTDCKSLGLDAPVNLSGNLQNAADVIMVGTHGVLEAKNSVIVAKAHIHLTPTIAKELSLTNGESVMVDIHSKRPITINDVIIRVSDKFAPAMHIDFDEANVCAYDKNTSISIKTKDNAIKYTSTQCIAINTSEKQEPCNMYSEYKLVSEAIAVKILSEFTGDLLKFKKGTIITPSAKDVFSDKKIHFIVNKS